MLNKNTKTMLNLHLTSCHNHSNNCTFATLLKYTSKSAHGKDY
jgi:hypothetical protein